MTRLLRAAVLLVVVLALAGATGCFGSNNDENAYVDQLNRVQNEVAGIVTKAQTSTPSELDAKAQAIQSFDKFEKALDKLIAGLKAVHPPAKVETLHDVLIFEMQQFLVQGEEAAASLTASTGEVIEEALARFATEAKQSGKKIRRTISEINDKLQE